MSSGDAFPRDFICEHTPSKSRVFAVLSIPSQPDTLKAVLTCTSASLAQRAARLLSSLAQSGGGPMTDADATVIEAALPSAPAASFREACQRLRNRQWLHADASAVVWDHSRDDNNDGIEPPLRDQEARTPTEAKLSQLAGRALRVIQFAEYHVHDQDRLLHAASASGWSSVCSVDDDSDLEEDLLSAAMHLAGEMHTMPGADMISQESIGDWLTVAAGHELADWQAEPVTASFSSGWRLYDNEPGSVDDEQDADDPATPDFAALFPLESCELSHADEDEQLQCRVCGGWQLTPRTADMLYTALEYLSDEAYDDVDEHGNAPVTRQNSDDWNVFCRFPRLTWQADKEWRRQVARACDDLSDELAAGNWPIPRCTAEEMILHLAIEDAPDCLEENADPGSGNHAALPAHPDDYTWEACSDLLFQDSDVLMLFNTELDGIEDPEGNTNKFLRVGDLRPQAWFKHFNDVEPRDPSRGFRR